MAYQKEKVIGRENEKGQLDRCLNSTDPELVAIYGRLRVGKTFLVREHLAKQLVFELTGLQSKSMSQQLENCWLELQRCFPGHYIAQPESWINAFEQLRSLLETSKTKPGNKRVLFFDEFPWLATRRSNFLNAFGKFWNDYASRESNLVVIICGSAASWMIRKVIKDKGGLHNRVTTRICLQPFSLKETRQYLKHRRVQLDDYQICQLYMAIGGVPLYLSWIKPGESTHQSIDRLCFDEGGMLKDEFQHLYAALFENHIQHVAIIRALAKKSSGLVRNELLAAMKLTSGGGVTTTIEELIQSGFIHESPPLNNKKKGTVYRLKDEYSLFYLKWIENNRSSGNNIWMRKSSSPAYRTWCGYAFETLCLKHVAEIKNALSIGGVETEESSWFHRPVSEQDEGAQVDLVIDRRDRCINLCEMKFSEDTFTISKSYARNLERKVRVFKRVTKTRNTVFLTMVTSFGVKKNEYCNRLVNTEVTLSDLMK